MERDSVFYKIRRKGQVLAHKLLPAELLSKVYCKRVLGQWLNIAQPKTFNEKLQWLKLYYFPQNPLAVQAADKYAVREYVENKGLGHILVPLIGAWKDTKEIPWGELPSKFILKCNHGCAYNILCHDKDSLDLQKTEAQLNAWMKEDFGAFNLELHYSAIRPRMIVCEEYLGACITDYKFFCFNGEPKYMLVSKDSLHHSQAQVGFFYLDGTKMPLKRDDYAEIGDITLPPFYEDMKKAAQILCKDFPFVRVDFFIANDRYYFAELTLVPAAGMMPFNPKSYDLEWGNMLNISEEMETSHKA